MEKTYNLFKRFIPAVIILASVGLIFSLFTLIYYYNPALKSIEFKNVIPIFTVLIFASAVIVSIVFTVQTKKIHITRIKKTSSMSKFAALLSVALGTALFLYDFIAFVIYPSTTSPLKILRLLVFIPFIAYLVIQIIPTKIKKKHIHIPNWTRVATSICAITWCILGLLAIYFWTGLEITNVFKIMHMFYYVFAVLFFLFEIKFELVSQKSHKGYLLSALVLFSYTFITSGAIIITKFLGGLNEINISDFEMFMPLALGLYALSKMIAIQYTIKFVIAKEKQTIHEHKHHHHRHHHSHRKDESQSELSNVHSNEGTIDAVSID